MQAYASRVSRAATAKQGEHQPPAVGADTIDPRQTLESLLASANKGEDQPSAAGADTAHPRQTRKNLLANANEVEDQPSAAGADATHPVQTGKKPSGRDHCGKIPLGSQSARTNFADR